MWPVVLWLVGMAIDEILGFTKGAGLALVTGDKTNTSCCAK